MEIDSVHNRGAQDRKWSNLKAYTRDPCSRTPSRSSHSVLTRVTGAPSHAPKWLLSSGDARGPGPASSLSRVSSPMNVRTASGLEMLPFTWVIDLFSSPHPSRCHHHTDLPEIWNIGFREPSTFCHIHMFKPIYGAWTACQALCWVVGKIQKHLQFLTGTQQKHLQFLTGRNLREDTACFGNERAKKPKEGQWDTED